MNGVPCRLLAPNNPAWLPQHTPPHHIPHVHQPTNSGHAVVPQIRLDRNSVHLVVPKYRQIRFRGLKKTVGNCNLKYDFSRGPKITKNVKTNNRNLKYDFDRGVAFTTTHKNETNTKHDTGIHDEYTFHVRKVFRTPLSTNKCNFNYENIRFCPGMEKQMRTIVTLSTNFGLARNM